jgi:hypothetical protein
MNERIITVLMREAVKGSMNEYDHECIQDEERTIRKRSPIGERFGAKYALFARQSIDMYDMID